MTAAGPLTSPAAFDRLVASGDSLADRVLRDLDLRGRELVGVEFGNKDGASALLEGVDLTGAVLIDCTFTGCQLSDVRLRGARLERCDLRYVDTDRVQLQDATLVGCDLYRARLGPRTVLRGATLQDCSLNLVEWDGAQIDHSALHDAVVQASEPAYERFLAQVPHDGMPADHDEAAIARRHAEAASIHRNLSGYWSSRAQHVDAAWAYVRARRHEAAHRAPWRAAARARRFDGASLPAAWAIAARSLPAWVGNVLADVVSGHGERPLRVLASLLAIVVGFAVTFSLTGAVAPTPTPPTAAEALRSSIAVLTTTLPDDHVRSALGAWLVAAETGIGIVLLGLLGFVLGNRIRQH